MKPRLLLAVALLVPGMFAVVPAAKAGGGCNGSMNGNVAPSSSSKATITECAFQPIVTYIQQGDTVTWTNKDFVPHTVSGAGGLWGSDAPMKKGDSVTYTFEDEGVFPYYCAYHPSMVGAVVVGDAKGDSAMIGGATIRQNDANKTESGGALSGDDGTGADGLLLTAVAIVLVAGVWFTRRTVSARRGRASFPVS